mgnify:CR=1 FL=1
MKKKKVICILGGIIAAIIVFCLIAFTIDKNRVRNDKEPIFSYNQSGGSAILYYGPGYVISGAVDDNPGGLKYAKFYTWIECIYQLIVEEANVGVQEDIVQTVAKDEGISLLITQEKENEYLEENTTAGLYRSGEGEVFCVEHTGVCTESEQFVNIYGVTSEGEIYINKITWNVEIVSNSYKL